MSDPTPNTITVKLVGAASYQTPGGARLRKGKAIVLREDHPDLPYYRSRSDVFDVRPSTATPAPRTLPQRRQAKETHTVHEVPPAAPQDAPAAVVEAPPAVVEAPPASTVSAVVEGERRVFGASEVYTETQLKALKRAELVQIAEDIGLEVADRETRAAIINRLLNPEEDSP